MWILLVTSPNYLCYNELKNVNNAHINMWGGVSFMRIGFISSTSKRMLIQNFCIAYRGILSKHDLYATNTTGSLIEAVTNLKIHKCIAGSLGGVKQLEALIEQNQLDMVIYFKSTELVDRNDPSVNNILALCDQYNIPVATNLATAELLIKALENGDLEWRSLYN